METNHLYKNGFLICQYFSQCILLSCKTLKINAGRNHGTFLEKSWCFLMEIMVISPRNCLAF